MIVLGVAADAEHTGLVVRLWDAITVAHLTFTVLLASVSRLLHGCLQPAAAAPVAAALSASETV